ncbi:DUF2732 domain-containing protein [Pantoea ananatis]|uniref:DUF2732 family protein n=1 Tax=Pantoea ananas TaxID=553 RepID=UPI00248C9B76|nr:DUF2732 family protein [Pantoea ananatis]MCK0555202.1 DUF2732 domain-containing protein [Pantoea ananatis]
MMNTETHPMKDTMAFTLNKLLDNERKACALAVAKRLSAIAAHITRQTLNGIEAAELLRSEAERYENESGEMR